MPRRNKTRKSRYKSNSRRARKNKSISKNNSSKRKYIRLSSEQKQERINCKTPNVFDKTTKTCRSSRRGKADGSRKKKKTYDKLPDPRKASSRPQCRSQGDKWRWCKKKNGSFECREKIRKEGGGRKPKKR